MADKVLRYRGRRVENLTRKELIKALYSVMALLERERRWYEMSKWKRVDG